MKQKLCEAIELMQSKKDCAKWAKRLGKVLLEKEDYYEYLSADFVEYKSMTGFDDKRQTMVSSKIYINEKKSLAIAQVSCQKLVPKVIMGMPIDKQMGFEIYLATYLERNGKIVLLQRFDQAALYDHQNDYSIFQNLELRALAQKYFTDYHTESNCGRIRYFAKLPHFHFNTHTQSKMFSKDSSANAISLDNLIKYIKDLENCNNENSPLLKHNLGLPFLDIKNNEVKYESNVTKTLAKLSSSDNMSKFLRGFMCELLLFKFNSGFKTPLQEVAADLQIMKTIDDYCKRNGNGVGASTVLEAVGASFMKSLINVKSKEKNLDKVNGGNRHV